MNLLELTPSGLYCPQADIFIDQIVGGWYGTAAIEAMALGRPTICFLRESYFDHINYGTEIPIINAMPATLFDMLKKLLKENNNLSEIGKKSREFVEKYHDVRVLSRKLISVYNYLHNTNYTLDS